MRSMDVAADAPPRGHRPGVLEQRLDRAALRLGERVLLRLKRPELARAAACFDTARFHGIEVDRRFVNWWTTKTSPPTNRITNCIALDHAVEQEPEPALGHGLAER